MDPTSKAVVLTVNADLQRGYKGIVRDTGATRDQFGVNCLCCHQKTCGGPGSVQALAVTGEESPLAMVSMAVDNER